MDVRLSPYTDFEELGHYIVVSFDKSDFEIVF